MQKEIPVSLKLHVKHEFTEHYLSGMPQHSV